MTKEDSLTQRLRAYFGGKAETVDELLREIFPMLREIAARELHRDGYRPSLSPSDLIHEIWLRNLSRASWTIHDQGHFYAIASLAMRRVLKDMARKCLAQRRSAGQPMPEEKPALKNGAEKDARQIVEIAILMDRLEEELPDSARVVDMHYFAGFTFVEIAESCDLSARQVRLRWKKGIQWLKRIHEGASGS